MAALVTQADPPVLKSEIDRGLADIAAGRVWDFDAERIIAQGKLLLAIRPSSV